MTPEEITSLAREYAEEIYPHEEGEDLGQMSFLRNNAIKHISSTFKMLTRRYVLVEKARVEEKLQAVNNQIKSGEELGLNRLTAFGHANKALLSVLFPDVAKEVES